MRARMERLECENTQLMNLFEASQEALKQETCLSFRNQVAELEAQRDELLARLDVSCEVGVIGPAYSRIRAERVFAADDLEHNPFSAVWKEAISSMKGGAA